MWVRILSLFMFMGILILVGCSPHYYKYPGRSYDFRVEQENLNKYIDPAQYFPTYNAETDPKKKRDIRNEIINAHIFIIDLYFYKSSQLTSFGRTAFNLGSDLAVLGLGLAGPLAPAATTKNVLTPIIAGITGAKTPVDKDIFYEQSMPALISKCEALRQVRFNEIDKKLDLGIDQYPLTAALSDLEQYFQAGTIPYALVQITATAGAQAEKAKEETTNRMEVKILQDEAGRLIRKFLMPDGKLSISNQDEIVARLKKFNITVREDHKTLDIINFSYDPKYIDDRKKVVEDLHLTK